MNSCGLKSRCEETVRWFPIPLQWGVPWDDGRASGLLPEDELGHTRRDSLPGSEGPGFG